MSHGVLPSQIRTLDSGLTSARAMTSGGGANGQPGFLAIGYPGIPDAASVALLVRVSDVSGIYFFSFLDMDGKCRTCRSRPARALGLLGRRVRDEQDDDTVLIPLIEHL